MQSIINTYLPQVKYHVENEQEENFPCRINHLKKSFLSTEKVPLNKFFIFVDVKYIFHTRFFLNASQITVVTIRFYSDITQFLNNIRRLWIETNFSLTFEILCTVLLGISVLKIQILNSDFYIFYHCYYKKLITCIAALEPRLVFTQNYLHTCILWCTSVGIFQA